MQQIQVPSSDVLNGRQLGTFFVPSHSDLSDNLCLDALAVDRDPDACLCFDFGSDFS